MNMEARACWFKRPKQARLTQTHTRGTKGRKKQKKHLMQAAPGAHREGEEMESGLLLSR